MIVLDLDPNVVQPGWTPLIITVLLGVAIVLLFFSMRRQVPQDQHPADGDRAARPGSGRTPARLRSEPSTGVAQLSRARSGH